MNWIFHSLLKLAHTHESWHREEIGIYILPEGKCITFFKATCFWIIMIRIYSLQYTLFKYFIIRQFFSYFCYVNSEYYFFCNFKILLRIVKMLLSKVCYFWINHISRLRSVLSTYLADFSHTILSKREKYSNNLLCLYVYCAM